jgi:phosphatidylethanolamine N-methyltransferase
MSSSIVVPSSPGTSRLVLDPETPSLFDTPPLNELPGSGSDCFINAYPDLDAFASSTPTNVNTAACSEASPSSNTDTLSLHTDDGDPDDFTFWEEQQAKRICFAIEQIFGVEYAPEVIVADANLTALANRILLSKEILTG